MFTMENLSSERIVSLQDSLFIRHISDISNSEAVGQAVILFILVSVAIVFYFLPTIIALSRNHDYKVVIAAVNLFCAWTGLAWLAILAWSVWPRHSISRFSLGQFSTWPPQQTGHKPPPFPSASGITPFPLMNDMLSSAQIESLEKIGRLRKEGILNEDEFNTAKKRILNPY